MPSSLSNNAFLVRFRERELRPDVGSRLAPLLQKTFSRTGF